MTEEHYQGLFQSYIGKIKKNAFLKNIMLLSGSTALGQLILALASPILTRLYSPSDFGLFSQYMAITSVVVVISSLRYELAIPLPEKDETAVSLVYLSLFLVLVIAALTGVVLSFTGGYLTAYTKSPGLLAYLWLVPFGVVGAGAYQTLNYWAVRRSAFGALSKTRLRQSVGQLVGQLSLGIAISGPMGLFWGDVLGRFSGTVYLIRQFLEKDGRNPGIKSFVASAKEYSRFPLLMTSAGLLNALALQVPFIMLPSYFGVAATGSYFQAYRMLILPATLVGGAVSQVFFGESAKLRSEPEKLKELTSRLVFTILSVNAPIYVGLSFVGVGLFSVVFGAAWSEAGHIAQILSPMILIWSVASPLSTLLIVGNRLKESLLFTIVELVFKILPILVGAYYHSLTVAVIGISLFGTVLAFLALSRFLRIAGIHTRELAGILFRVLCNNCPLLLVMVCSVKFTNLSMLLFLLLMPLTMIYSVKSNLQAALARN